MQEIKLRTAIHVEEAVAVLLGLVDLETLVQLEVANTYVLNSMLGDPVGQDDEEIHDRAFTWFKAIGAELRKGTRSALRVDWALSRSNTETYITVDSFRAWAIGSLPAAQMPGGAQPTLQLPDGRLPGVAEAANPAEVSVSGTKKKKGRDKGRRQDDAILAALREKKFNLSALPRSPSGLDGVRKEIYEVLKDSPLFETRKIYETAWKRCFDLKLLAYEAAPTPLQKED